MMGMVVNAPRNVALTVELGVQAIEKRGDVLKALADDRDRTHVVLLSG